MGSITTINLIYKMLVGGVILTQDLAKLYCQRLEVLQ